MQLLGKAMSKDFWKDVKENDLIEKQLIVCVSFQIVLQRPKTPGVVLPWVANRYLAQIDKAADAIAVKQYVRKAKISVDDGLTVGF